MRLYAAPMEGITGYIYRNAHKKYYNGIDKYFTPFLTPKAKRGMNTKERNDILPEHNQGIYIVPQILTNRADEFVTMVQKLADYGYQEFNLNLGCPSGTVVSKKKGSGFLLERELLDRFFAETFEQLQRQGLMDLKYSVKSRLAFEEEEDMLPLIEIYNQYPISELILHARVREDYYKKPVRREAFAKALEESKIPVCYNGDIFSREDCLALQKRFPEVTNLMIGRGMIRNPQLSEQLQEEASHEFDRKRFSAFHDEICSGYEEIMSGERNVLFKMKELWSYMIDNFNDSDKIAKKIKKSKNLTEYKAIVQTLF